MNPVSLHRGLVEQRQTAASEGVAEHHPEGLSQLSPGGTISIFFRYGTFGNKTDEDNMKRKLQCYTTPSARTALGLMLIIPRVEF